MSPEVNLDAGSGASLEVSSEPSPESVDIEAVRTRFANDRFATDACGCVVLEAAPGHSVCAFDITDKHLNARGAVMGGAIFTLADFALAVASNLSGDAVSVANTIEYLAATRGTRLTCRCDADREGRALAFYTCVITDDLGVDVARMTATCFRVPQRRHA